MGKVQPKDLQELSSIAVAAHIANVCLSLLQSVEAYKQMLPSAYARLTNSISDGFKSAFTSKIPSAVATKLTNLWLAYLDWSFKTSKLTFTKESDMILLHIIQAIVHPRVTHLECNSAKIQTMLLRSLDMMERLEKLEVPGLDSITQQCLVDNISKLKHLVSLSVHFNCTDEILNLIGDSCPNIEDLDVFGSSYVGNKSVPAILKLSRLKALNVFGTNISVTCVVKIIQTVKDRGNGLTKFGCSNFETVTSEALLQHKDSLVSLQLATELYDMFALTSLIHLKAIMFHFIQFGTLRSFLYAFGGNLGHLELHSVGRVDVLCVGECCPHLERFEMHNCTYSPWTHVHLSQGVTVFANLKVLKMHLMSKYPMLSHMDSLVVLIILHHAHDIRHISIATYTNLDRGFINILLSVNPLLRLEEFNLGSTSETLIDPKTLLHLLKDCKNLHQVTVNGIEVVQRPLSFLHFK